MATMTMIDRFISIPPIDCFAMCDTCIAKFMKTAVGPTSHYLMPDDALSTYFECLESPLSAAR